MRFQQCCVMQTAKGEIRSKRERVCREKQIWSAHGKMETEKENLVRIFITLEKKICLLLNHK